MERAKQWLLLFCLVTHLNNDTMELFVIASDIGGVKPEEEDFHILFEI